MLNRRFLALFLVSVCAFAMPGWSAEDSSQPPDWLLVDDEDFRPAKKAAIPEISESVEPGLGSTEDSPFIVPNSPAVSGESPADPDWKNRYSNRLQMKNDIRKNFKAKDWDKVLSLLEVILELEPDNREMLYKKAYTLKNLNKLEASLRVYDKVTAVAPDFRDAFYDRGVVLKKLDRFEEAIVSFDKAVAIRDNNSWVHYDRGILLKRLRRVNEAIKAFERAVELNGNHHWAMLELANIFKFRGQYVHAMKYYQKVMELNPKAIGVAENLEFCIKKLEKQ